jgi:2',3'-cyclic-nucleotide 2'-phosphodiesterase/3'-nucleotidase/5'-nucleotidase
MIDGIHGISPRAIAIGVALLTVSACADDGDADGDGGTEGSSSGGPGSGPEPTTVTVATLSTTAPGDDSSTGEPGDDTMGASTGEPTTGEDDGSSSTGEPSAGELELQLLGRYESGIFDAGAAEIPAFDPVTMRLFVVNAQGGTVDVLDLSDPATPVLVDSLAMSDGGSPNSVDVSGDVVAVAVQAADPQAPGRVELFATDGAPIASVTVGALPDMVTFTPDGTHVIVANEGEPNAMYTVDPEGSVSIVDLSGGVDLVTDDDVVTAGFGGFTLPELDASVRIFGPGASVAEDLEPEYVAVSPDGTTAWVTLQENNALAIVDLQAGEVTEIVGLGAKDHSVEGHGLDPSDQDGAVAIATWPVSGLYLPDAIAAFEAGGESFLVTANEGDARDYDGFAEETRIEDLVLDPVVFPDAAALQAEAALGRLRVTSTLGDVDDDGDHDELFAFGTRSISIWSADGTLVWDSGDALEQAVAELLPEHFNANNTDNDSLDGRSDDKGPEPEGVVVAEVLGSTFAFVGLERVGGIAVFDLADPRAPVLVSYVSDRDFTGDPEAGTAGDLGPEGLVVIAAADSPTAAPLLVVANEVSGSVAVYEIGRR